MTALVLAGCGSAPSPTPSPSQSPSPIPTASPAASPASSAVEPMPPPSVLPSPGAGPSPVPSLAPASPPTRVALEYLRIDLPVLRPPAHATFPRCDVAEYFAHPVFQYPGEAGVVYVYAHARTGMFLPILEVSQRNNGKALIGREVTVWTDGSLRFTYRITAVRRHQKSLAWAYDLGSGSLVLQTSETPYRDGPKVMVVARQVGDPVAVAYVDAHPRAHPVACR